MNLTKLWEGNKKIIEWSLFAFAIIFFVFYQGHLMTPERSVIAYGKTDLAVFYVAGAAITGRMDITPIQLYERKSIKSAIKEVRSQDGGTYFLYPPQAALFFAPLSLTDIKTTTSTWRFFNALLFLFSLFLIIHYFIGDKKIERLRYSLFVILLTFASPISGLFKTGQINGVIWFLLLAAMVFLMKKKEYTAGTLLAIATAIKIFPILFFPYLLIKKKWKAAMMMTVASFLFLGASIPFFGIDVIPLFIEKTLIPLSNASIGTITKSVSLYGSFRVGVANDLYSFFGDLTRKQIINRFDPFYSILTLGSLLFVGWNLWKHRFKETGYHYMLDFSLIILFFILLSKNVHAQYLFWILPVLFWILSLPFKKEYITLFTIGGIILLFTQFVWILPEWASFIGFIKLHTLGALLLSIVTILIRSKRWYKKIPELAKYNTTDG